MKTSLFLLLSSVILISACQNDAAPKLPELDLLAHGMPIVIHAPENAEIKKMDLVLSKDLTVTSGKDFLVQIFESDADTRDVGIVKKRLMDEVKENPYFSEIIQDDAAGFIYETKIDSNYVNYGFRHVRIQGDKEYVFQQGLQGKFSKEAVETMYEAVR